MIHQRMLAVFGLEFHLAVSTLRHGSAFYIGVTRLTTDNTQYTYFRSGAPEPTFIDYHLKIWQVLKA